MHPYVHTGADCVQLLRWVLLLLFVGAAQPPAGTSILAGPSIPMPASGSGAPSAAAVDEATIKAVAAAVAADPEMKCRWLELQKKGNAA